MKLRELLDQLNDLSVETLDTYDVTIEQDGEAVELEERPFKIYATREQFIRLSEQALDAARTVEIGWVEFNPLSLEHKVVKKPQDPSVKKWVK